jgi:P-type Ca2+ transporter type 2C
MPEPFDIKQIPGLSEAEASRRLAQEGYNELPSSRRRGILNIAWEVVREPMFLLLLACGVVYLTLGEPKEALMLLGFVFVIMGITIVQERRTERALEALRDLSSPRALVIRDGRQIRIAGREVARGDWVIISEGDRVPADGVLRYSVNLSTDESLLTGESVPVRKIASTTVAEMDRPGGDDLSSVFSGTLVTMGQGVAEVLRTGVQTQIGRIGKALQTLEPEQTLLQKETGRLVRSLAVIGLSLCAIVVVMYALSRGNTLLSWKQGFLAGIAMAMATLPEEFPVVLTIFLALGAWRISQKRVLTRRMPVIETLGAATVLCVDKTGTLTQNRMSIRKLACGPEIIDLVETQDKALPETFHAMLEFAMLASKADPFDPMEKAIRLQGDSLLAQTEHLHEKWNLFREYPLSPELLALSHIWRSPDGKNIMIAAKGAPEAIVDLCHLNDGIVKEVSRQAASMANEGLRVLGVAKGTPHQITELPQNQHDFDFQFLGLLGLADPIRPAVPQAVEECRQAGIRVIMITGDYPGTAQSIGRQIGLPSEKVLTGPDIENLTDEQLCDRLRDTALCARVVPEQKLRIVTALKTNGEVVAMTGDGVNDAPALKAAHIGVAMGGRGTDVAREAAGLVLLDDDFSSIVEAVRSGRRIFDNIKKAVAYIFAVHVPIAGLSLVPVFFADWPLILMPVHILFLELIIDPSCTMIFEAEQAEKNIMARLPRKPDERLFGLKSLGISLVQGLSVLFIMLGVFLAARLFGHSDDNARGLTFAALVVANLGLILTNRSWSRTIWSMMKAPNTALRWVLAGAIGFLGLVFFLPPLRSLFHFAAPHRIDLIICLTAGGVSIGWFECLKLMRKQKITAKSP